jgi:hypothetical protein
MKRNLIYWALILVISFLVTFSWVYSLNIPKPEDENYVRDGYMNIKILPVGTLELKDPLGRRIIHYLNKKEDIVEIPHACYCEEAFAEEELLSGNIDIISPIGGHYELKILQVSGAKYMLNIRVENEEGNKVKDATFFDVPIAKGQTHIYDIQFDKTNYLVNAILRK